jgi:hypothetical protein
MVFLNKEGYRPLYDQGFHYTNLPDFRLFQLEIKKGRISEEAFDHLLSVRTRGGAGED